MSQEYSLTYILHLLIGCRFYKSFHSLFAYYRLRIRLDQDITETMRVNGQLEADFMNVRSANILDINGLTITKDDHGNNVIE